MNIRFLGQSGYELCSGNTRILIDPYFSDVVGRLHGRPRQLPVPMSQEEMPCDGVFCTHNHLDHLDPETAILFPESQKFFTTNDGVAVLQSLNRKNAEVITPGTVVSCGDFTVTAVFAAHTVEAVGLIIQAEGYTLYFSGDTLFDEKLFDIRQYKPDITFICINGRLGNMTSEEALITAKKIGAKVNIPNHYDMFAYNSENPNVFAQRIDGGKILEFNKSYTVQELLL